VRSISLFPALAGVQNSVQLARNGLDIPVRLEAVEQLQVHAGHLAVKRENLQSPGATVSSCITTSPLSPPTHHVCGPVAGEHALRASDVHHLRVDLVQRRRCTQHAQPALYPSIIHMFLSTPTAEPHTELQRGVLEVDDRPRELVRVDFGRLRLRSVSEEATAF
jgi:hypothetical protein